MASPLKLFQSMKSILDIDNFRLAPLFDALATKSFLRPDPKLEYALSNSSSQGLPPISVLPLSGQYLTILAGTIGAKSVLEIGSLGGYSAICFARAGAKVTSIEIDPKHRDVALENVKDLEVEILLGAALDVLPRLVEEGRKYDLVFIDADFDDQWEHFDWAVRVTRSKGCIFLDDVVVSMLKNEELGKEGENIVTRIGGDERVLATFLPTVVSHPALPTPVFNGAIMAMVKDY